MEEIPFELDLEAEEERKLQDNCKHEWEGRKIYIPGEPDDYVEYCKHCGINNPGSWVD